MKIYGKKGLGSILKVLLEIVFISIIIMMIIVPFKYKKVIVFYPNIICLLIIMYAFIGLFDSLKKEEAFCAKTVKKMNMASIASGVCSIFWLIQVIYDIVFAKGYLYDLFFDVFLLFMFVLFLGVSIALYILKELFIKATNYKEENDLTI